MQRITVDDLQLLPERYNHKPDDRGRSELGDLEFSKQMQKSMSSCLLLYGRMALARTARPSLRISDHQVLGFLSSCIPIHRCFIASCADPGPRGPKV